MAYNNTNKLRIVIQKSLPSILQNGENHLLATLAHQKLMAGEIISISKCMLVMDHLFEELNHELRHGVEN
jgi:hypothetical protein